MQIVKGNHVNRDKRQSSNIKKRVQTFLEKIAHLKPVEWFLTYWNDLPSRHQTIVKFLLPAVLVVWLLPLSSDDSVTEEVVLAPPKATQERVSLSLNIPGVEQEDSTAEDDSEAKPKRVSLSENNAKETEAPEEVVDTSAGPKPWTEHQVQAGDNLTRIFQASGLDLEDLNDLLKVEGKGSPLSQIHVGQTIRYRLTNRGRLDILQIKDPQKTVMYFRLSSGGFSRSQ